MTDAREAIQARYGTVPDGMQDAASQSSIVGRMLSRGSCRAYLTDRLERPTLETLAAAALASPTKSDLQQRDILFVEDSEIRAWINGLFPGMPWIAEAPHFVVFLANNRRQRQVHAWRGHAFENDHLDAFFNATVDAAVALSAFVTAAEELGFGTCPISELRNVSHDVSKRLALPDHVIPICGLTLGRPLHAPRVSPRLGLDQTVHWDRYSEQGIEDAVAAYDARRNEARPFPTQRQPDRFGIATPYTWSEDKARQYAVPQRTDFGTFVRSKGFNLD